MPMKRGVFDFIFFLVLFILPWWVSVILAFVGIFIFKNFYEFTVAAIILYSLYFIGGTNFLAYPFYFFAVVIIIYFVLQAIRHKMIFYK